MTSPERTPPPFTEFVPEQRFQPTVAISPDGSTVAYSSNVSGQYQLWVVPIDGGQATRLTDDPDLAVRGVAWSPDGGQLLYLADRDGDEQYQVYLVSRSGGASRRLTSALDRQHVIGDSPFAPDGSFVVYGANDRDPATQDVLVHCLDAVTDESAIEPDDAAVGDPAGIRRIESKPGVLLFPVAVSPDGRWLSVLGARSNTDSDAGVVDLTQPDLAVRWLTPHDDEVQHLPGPWRADSSGFAVRTDAGREFIGLSEIDVAGGPLTPVTAADWDVELVTATRDGDVIVWVVNEAGRSVPHVRRAPDDDIVVDVPGGQIEALDIAPDGTCLVALVDTATRPCDLAVVPIGTAPTAHDGAGDALRYLTDSRPAALARVPAVAPQHIEYPTHDGRDIPAWLYRPAGDGPFPVLLSVHGGPEAQERPTYTSLYQFLLANGVGVLAPNIRGSTGYGTSYQRLIHRDWGGAELGDLDHATRYLRGLDWVDGSRLGVFGGSFGGFAALSCLSRLPDLWAAGVSLVGPSNLMTLVRSVPPTWQPLMAAWIGDPEHDEELLVERSPLTYADQIRAPLFVIQGAKDPRVVKAESDQMVESLRNRGVDVRYDVYDDEGHGFTRRENEIRALTDVGEFLVARLGDAG